MLQCPAPVAAIVSQVEEPRKGSRITVMSDFLVTVIAGQVVTLPRHSAYVHADGAITVPIGDE